MQHIIPDGEEELHEESEYCPCNPCFAVDKATGEMIWVHVKLNWDDFVNIDYLCCISGWQQCPQ